MPMDDTPEQPSKAKGDRGARSFPQLQEGVPPRAVEHHWLTWGSVLSLLLWTSVALLANPSMAKSGYVHLFVAGAGLTYVIHSFALPTFRYLWNLNPVEDVVTYVRQLRAAPPQIGFTCECYHMETRTRQVTEAYTEYSQQYDSLSRSYRSVPVTKYRTRTETYQERVVTYRGNEAFLYSRWEDVSPQLTPDIYKYQATRIDLSLRVECGDQETWNRYLDAKHRFIDSHKRRDRSFDFHEYKRVDGFRPHVMSIVDLTKQSPLMHWFPYTASTLLGLSWVYRTWFERVTVVGDISLWKRVYV